MEKIWRREELFPFPLVVATLGRIEKGMLYSEGEIHFRGQVWRVKVNNWGMPEEGSKIIVGMEEETPHFLPWGGEKKEEIIDFLVTLPFPAEEGEEVSSSFR